MPGQPTNLVESPTRDFRRELAAIEARCEREEDSAKIADLCAAYDDVMSAWRAYDHFYRTNLGS